MPAMELGRQFTPSPEEPRTPEIPFDGQLVIITGANRQNGIGFAIAREFAFGGAAHLILPHRAESAKSAEEAATQLAYLGATVTTLSGDITHPDAPLEIYKYIKKEMGLPVNTVVNNMGNTNGDGPLLRVDAAKFDETMIANVRVATLFTAAAASYFDRKGGSIINIGSIVGTYGHTGQELYGVSKAALEGLTKSAAIDLGRRNIRVNTVAPGFVPTDVTAKVPEANRRAIEASTPLGRLGTAEDVAHLVTFLASPKGEFITGQTIIVDGGLGGGIGGINGLLREGTWTPKPARPGRE